MVSPYTAGRIPLTATGQIPSVLQPSEPDSTNGSPELPDMTSIAPLPRTRISTTPPASPPRGSSVPYTNGKSPGTGLLPQRSGLMESPQIPQGSAIADVAEVPEAGPSSAPVRRVYPKKPKKKVEKLFQHTTAFAPGLFHVKNPAGEFIVRETNVDVIRQISQARAKAEKEEAEAERAKRVEAGEEVGPVQPLSHTLIIHPGSRNLRIGRASDFYPKEIPFCIARPSNSATRSKEAVVPGSRAKRLAEEAKEKKERKRQKISENGNAAARNGTDDGEEEWVDPVDQHIEDLRDYLRNRLRQNRLSTDYRDGFRVKQHNAKVRPEPIPEHNDPYRIDWTEVDGKKFFVGTDALRLPSGSGFKVRYPLLHRGLNMRDWESPQSLMDDIATILHESLRTELDIHPRDYHKYSVVLLIPDHNDRLHLQALVSLLFGEFGFKEIAIHQEGHAAIFSAGMSTACVVDIGATTTSVTCVDEGMLNPDTRIKLDYGGDDITAALVAMLTQSNFPYKELDLGKAMEWAMMDKLKEKICTLEEHMVANIAWDVYVLKEQGLTQKYQLRTYDENILAPLCFFDTRMIDFQEKAGSGRIAFWEEAQSVDDLLSTAYGEPTAAMRSCVTHLLPTPEVNTSDTAMQIDGASANGDASIPKPTIVEPNGSQASATSDKRPADTPAGSTNGTPAPPDIAPAVPLLPPAPAQADIPVSAYDGIDVIGEAARSPLDAAIAASIAMAGTENKVKAAAGSILLIGGGSALKGLYPFIAERLPPLLRAKGLPIAEVQIVPPPRGLNPRFVSWKGVSVMCNLESLSDMWIRRDEWEAIGARALKDRLTFL